MKKKICIITSSYPSYKNDSRDAGVFVKDVAILLAKKDFEVFVIAPLKKDSQNDESILNVKFFPWLSSDLGLSSYNPKNPIHFLRLISAILSGIFYTVKFIKENKIEYCFAMWAVPSGFFAWITKILFGTPYSVWVLGSDIWKIQEYPLGKIILKKVLKNANRLFADGLELASDAEKISEKNCEFLPSSRILDTTIKEIKYTKFHSRKKNFMFYGRYHTNKGVDLLIEAISLLKNEDMEKCVFHIFGVGPLEKKIRDNVRNLKLESNVFVNGYLDADMVYSYILKSDFVVIPSRIESIPLVLSDVMQAGKPVIVTNVGDMGKIAEQYKIGIIVEPDAKSIAVGLSQVIKMDQKQLDEFRVGIKNLKNYFDLEKNIKKLLGCFS